MDATQTSDLPSVQTHANSISEQTYMWLLKMIEFCCENVYGISNATS